MVKQKQGGAMKALMLMLLLLASCVSTTTHYDGFEGSWHSSQDTFGPFADEVELSIDNTSVSVYVDHEYKGTKSYVVSEGQMLMGWSVEMRGTDVIFYDATKTIDSDMLVRWKPIDYYYSFTSLFEE